MPFRLVHFGTLLTLLLLPGTASAAPTWLPASPVSDPGQAAADAKVAVDGGGGALVAWLRPSGMSARVEARYRPPGGAFGPLETLSGGGADALEVAMAQDGTAVAVWRRSGRLEAAVRPPGGTFGPASPISPPGEGVREPQIAIDGPGNATAAWASTAGKVDRIRVATRPPGGTFGESVEITSRTDTVVSETGNENALDQPRLAADPSGRAYLAFRDWEIQYIGGSPTTPTYGAQVRVRQPGGAFGSPLGLSPHSGPVQDFAIAAGPNGTAAVAWADRSNDSIAVRVRPPEGPFGPIESPADQGPDEPEPRVPALAVDAAGNIGVTWLYDPIGPGSVGADVRTVGTFFPVSPQTLSSTANSRLPQIAVDGHGVFHVAWHHRDDIPRILSSRRVPGGQFGAPVAISAPGQNNLDPSAPQIAADQEGNAVAVWDRNHEGGSRVEVAGHDGAPPRLAGLSIPATGSVGRAAPLSAAAFDTWSPVTSVVWDFGDGTGAAGPATNHTYDRPRSYALSVTATDAVGNAATAGGAIAVTDEERPRLRRLRLSRNRFRLGRRATRRVATAQRRRGRTKVGTVVRYQLSEDARVVFTIERARAGRRSPRSGRCVKPSRRLVQRRAKRCTRYVRAGRRLTRRSHAGANRFRFTGRIGRNSLRPGRHRLTARAIDFGGNRSRPARRVFRITRH